MASIPPGGGPSGGAPAPYYMNKNYGRAVEAQKAKEAQRGGLPQLFEAKPKGTDPRDGFVSTCIDAQGQPDEREHPDLQGVHDHLDEAFSGNYQNAGGSEGADAANTENSDNGGTTSYSTAPKP
jgi:hypothetical protein